MGFFGRDIRRTPQEALDSVVGPSASLTGHLRSDGGVRIDGTFEGVIEVAGNVVIGEGARVVANLTARNVTVGGAVKGNIDATGRLEILSTGQLFGDIMVAQVMIDDGGLFQGMSRMRGIEQRALAAPADEPQTSTPSEPVPPSRVEVQTVDVAARPAADVVEVEDTAAFDFEADDIEPIIPDVVIEDIRDEPPPNPPPRRRSRRGGS
jgi:cytoskeletal protein CcmA (bactofilin family)